MAEHFGLLHVRAISTLAAMRRIYDKGYKTSVLPRVAKEAFAWENEFFMEFWDIIKDEKFFEKDFSAVLQDVMWTKNHILVSAKSHNLLYPPVGTLFDPATVLGQKYPC
jgi:hypothetical protein